MTSPDDHLQQARIAASKGWHHDAAEHFARYLAARIGVALGDQPAMDFIRAVPVEMQAVADTDPVLAASIRQAGADWDEPPDPDFTSPVIELGPEGWERFCQLAGVGQRLA